MPLAVKFVVEAPPFALKSPLVMVEEALERKPFVNVARPVCVSVPVCVVLPETVSEPSVASCEKRFVDDAVVEKRFVVVPDVRERVPRVERPFTLSAPKFAVLALEVVEVAVPKYPIPLAVKFVVDAPPFIEKSPLVMVEEALERKPLVKVVKPLMPSVPRVAICEKRFVLDAVVAKKAVEVAPFCPIENTVVDALVTASNRLPVPHAVSLLYGVVVPMPTLPALSTFIPEVPPPVRSPLATMNPDCTSTRERVSKVNPSEATAASAVMMKSPGAELVLKVVVYVPAVTDIPRRY